MAKGTVTTTSPPRVPPFPTLRLAGVNVNFHRSEVRAGCFFFCPPLHFFSPYQFLLFVCYEEDGDAPMPPRRLR